MNGNYDLQKTILKTIELKHNYLVEYLLDNYLLDKFIYFDSTQ